jgi:hypothetical protein
MTRIWPTIPQAMANARRTAHPPLRWDPISHLLSRLAFGPTVATRNYVSVNGVSAWYRQQVTLGAAYSGYRGSPAVAACGPLLMKTSAQVVALKNSGAVQEWDPKGQLCRVTLGLQAWSAAQMYETLVDFFSNHLNVTSSHDVWTTRHTYDRDVIRKHAFGSFTDMLLAAARHPSMLTYLNLAQSTKQSVNENYGRELLELHTVGMIYSEDDVTNAAKVLTGRTIGTDYRYAYDPNKHWVGDVTVLGFTHPNSTAAGGEAAGDALIRYLATHPATAQNLAHKLCLRYVSDNPSSTLVSAIAQAYLDSGTRVEPMMLTMLHSDEFWQSRGEKVRRPAENLVATIRALGTRPANMEKALATMEWNARSMGHAPLEWTAPNGYPDVATAWRSSSTLVTEWTMHIALADSWWDGFAHLDKASLYGRAPHTSGEAITLLTRRLIGMTYSATHHAALQTMLGEPASTPMAKSRLKALIGPMIAVILNSPHHALR